LPLWLLNKNRLRNGEMSNWWWHSRAGIGLRKAASRYNLNLLKYGAMIAAVSIESGYGGVMAVANSIAVAGLPWWVPFQLLILSLIAGAILVIGVILVLRAYRLRYTAERDVELYMEKLIALRPERFLPDTGSLQGG
jgi:hypothetical protein